MAGIGPIRQDWEPVVVRKKAPTAAAKKDEKAVNAARRAGAEIETMRKCKWFRSFRLVLSFSSNLIFGVFFLSGSDLICFAAQPCVLFG